jgi:hypothetical protein
MHEHREGDLSSAKMEASSQLEDDAPFGGSEAMAGILGSAEMKPFRNVIKRYWTEDEVLSWLVTYIFRTRN